MTAVAGRAVADRVEGHRPSRVTALFTAAAAAAVTGVVVYKVLRSGGERA